MNHVSTHTNSNLKRRFKTNGFARLFSDLANPLLVPPAVIGLTGWLMGLTKTAISGIVVLSLFFFTIAPLLATFYLMRVNYIQSFDLPERKSRGKLFLFSIICAAFALLIFNLTPAQSYPVLGNVVLVFLTNLIIGYLINTVWKMSVHTASISSAGAIFLVFFQFNLVPAVTVSTILSLVILLLLLPLMIWARYRLHIHTIAELFGGAVAGFLFTILELSIFINIC